MHEQLVRLLAGGKKNAAKGSDLSPTPLSSRQATFLFLRRPEELEADEPESLLTLGHLHAEIDLADDLVEQFARMLRTRTGEQLDDWLDKVRASPIRELQGFVAGIERDKAAVVAGLTLPHNNGLVEGKVNQLKLIKRMMYGRARFALLRQRVLHALSVTFLNRCHQTGGSSFHGEVFCGKDLSRSRQKTACFSCVKRI